MKKPLVSIITPLYNDEKYILKTIKSIKQQSYPLVQHIIVDGNSTDNSLTLVKSFPSLEIISENDDGMYQAINKGVKLAKGEILAYLNSDDLYFPYTIETVVNHYLKTRNDVFIGYCSFIDDNDKILYTYRYPFLTNDICHKTKRMPFWQQSTFWTRSIMNEIGLFDEKYKLAGDFDFFIRLLPNAKITTIRKSLAKFRIHDNQLSKNYKKAKIEFYNVLNKHKISPRITPFKIFYEISFKMMNFYSILLRLLYTKLLA